MKISVDKLIERSVKNMGDGIHPVVKESAIETIKQAYKEDIYVQITSGYRSFSEQTKLYNQGRTDKSQPKVTNAKAGESNHNYGLAIDYVLLTSDGSRAIWTVTKEWKRVAEIGKKLGFAWGGDWTGGFKDYPHLEMMGGLSIRELQAGRRPTLKSKVASKTETQPVKKQEATKAPNKVEVKKEVKKETSSVPYPNKLFKVQSPLMSGKDVERIQRAVGMPEKNVDGKYGNDTKNMVKAYQKRQGLNPDGIVGKDTWNRMF